MGASPIRVLLVEPHAYVREALARVVATEQDLTVVGHAGSLAEARPYLAAVDVVVVDLDMPDGEGVALIAELRAVNPRAVVLALTTSTTRRALAVAVEAGAASVLPKSVSLAALITSVRGRAADDVWPPAQERGDLLRLAVEERRRREAAQRMQAELTAREREVLTWLAAGLSDKEIAQRLCVAPDTVQSHMLNLMRKLGVESRLQALIFAVRNGVARIE